MLVNAKTQNPFITSCAQYRMIGGVGILGKLASMSRVFDNLPPHWQVTLQFTFYK